MDKKTWTLMARDGTPFVSTTPGTVGGHRKTKIYGRLDCRAALTAIARGGCVAHRVFFLNEDEAHAAGYRPCAVCVPDQYVRWKASQPKR